VINKDDEKIILFINKLIVLTENSKLKWENIRTYLYENNNKPLKAYLVQFHQYYNSAFLNSDLKLSEENSYVIKINNGVVSVLTIINKKKEFNYLLLIQTERDADTIEMNGASQYQNLLINLISLINSQTKNIDKYIDDILKIN